MIALKIVINKPANLDLRRMSPGRRQIVVNKINQLAATGLRGDLAANIRPLRGSDLYRLRIGGDRVIFRIEDERLIIKMIRPRGSAYR